MPLANAGGCGVARSNPCVGLRVGDAVIAASMMLRTCSAKRGYRCIELLPVLSGRPAIWSGCPGCSRQAESGHVRPQADLG
jgi:hypothetical protein